VEPETVSANVSNRLQKLRNWFEQPVTLKGVLWSVALPVGWLALFYALVIHSRFSLGRWPHFGEGFDGLLHLHEIVVWLFGTPLYFSVFVAAFVFLACLFIRRLRHFSVYALGYAVALLLAYAAVFLAPGHFLNWFFD
jgi:hypothetical protein